MIYSGPEVLVTRVLFVASVNRCWFPYPIPGCRRFSSPSSGPSFTLSLLSSFFPDRPLCFRLLLLFLGILFTLTLIHEAEAVSLGLLASLE